MKIKDVQYVDNSHFYSRNGFPIRSYTEPYYVEDEHIICSDLIGKNIFSEQEIDKTYYCIDRCQVITENQYKEMLEKLSQLKVID